MCSALLNTTWYCKSPDCDLNQTEAPFHSGLSVSGPDEGELTQTNEVVHSKTYPEFRILKGSSMQENFVHIFFLRTSSTFVHTSFPHM